MIEFYVIWLLLSYSGWEAKPGMTCPLEFQVWVLWGWWEGPRKAGWILGPWRGWGWVASQKHLIFATLTVIWRRHQHPGLPVVLKHHLQAWHPDPAFSSPVAPVSFHLLPSPPSTPSKDPERGPVSLGHITSCRPQWASALSWLPAFPGDWEELEREIKFFIDKWGNIHACSAE